MGIMISNVVDWCFLDFKEGLLQHGFFDNNEFDDVEFTTYLHLDLELLSVNSFIASREVYDLCCQCAEDYNNTYKKAKPKVPEDFCRFRYLLDATRNFLFSEHLSDVFFYKAYDICIGVEKYDQRGKQPYKASVMRNMFDIMTKNGLADPSVDYIIKGDFRIGYIPVKESINKFMCAEEEFFDMYAVNFVECKMFLQPCELNYDYYMRALISQYVFKRVDSKLEEFIKKCKSYKPSKRKRKSPLMYTCSQKQLKIVFDNMCGGVQPWCYNKYFKLFFELTTWYTLYRISVLREQGKIGDLNYSFGGSGWYKWFAISPMCLDKQYIVDELEIPEYKQNDDWEADDPDFFKKIKRLNLFDDEDDEF